MFCVKKHKNKPKAEDDLDPLEKLKSLMGQQETIEKEKNHIYFYSEVSDITCLDLSRKINDLNKELLKFSIEYDTPPPSIYLHINSQGGDLLSAFGVVDVITNSRVPIVSIVTGAAASAATIISMVCHKRYITKHSFMLVHQLSSGFQGKYEEIKDDFDNDKKFMDSLYNLYTEHTTMSEKKIKEVLKHDIWWGSSECIEHGLVDAVWESNVTRVIVDDLFKTSTPKLKKRKL